MPDSQQWQTYNKNICKWIIQLLYTFIFKFFSFFLQTFLLSFILSLMSWTTWVIRVRTEQSCKGLWWVLFSKDYFWKPRFTFLAETKVAACCGMCFCVEEIAFHIKPNSDGIKTMMNLSNGHRTYQGWPGYNSEQAPFSHLTLTLTLTSINQTVPDLSYLPNLKTWPNAREITWIVTWQQGGEQVVSLLKSIKEAGMFITWTLSLLVLCSPSLDNRCFTGLGDLSQAERQNKSESHIVVVF